MLSNSLAFIETEYQIECAQKVVDHHKAMLDSISEGSPFLAELEARYTSDTEYEVSPIYKYTKCFWYQLILIYQTF